MGDDRYETLLANYRNAWAGLRMIREAVETLGPPGVLPSGEAVISLYGPESSRCKGLWTPWGPFWGMSQIQRRQSRNVVNAKNYRYRPDVERRSPCGKGRYSERGLRAVV